MCTEPRADLSYAYLGVLEALQEDLVDIVTPTWLDRILVERIGARNNAIAVDQKLSAQAQFFGCKAKLCVCCSCWILICYSIEEKDIKRSRRVSQSTNSHFLFVSNEVK